MEAETFTAYCTRYALTSGIFSFPARPVGNGMVQDTSQLYSTYYHGEGRDWHLTHASAVSRAEAMRTAKLKSLKASIAKLEKLDFTLKDTP